MRTITAAMKANGFSLIEVLIATAIVMGAVASLAHLFVMSGEANRMAGGISVAELLAVQKMEELRAGRGALAISPAGTLQANADGYADYLDAAGSPVGDSFTATPPAGTVYIRRWTVDPMRGSPRSPPGAMVLQVLVMPANRSRMEGTARLVTARRQ